MLGDGLVGVDLDHCRDHATGAIAAPARAIIDALASYTEISPSDTGMHVLVHGTLPPGRRRTGPIEMYDAGRYFTVTGAHLMGTPMAIEERTAALAALHRQLFPASTWQPAPRASGVLNLDDAQVLARAHAARNGTKFAALWQGDTSGYPSHSEADQALCNLLAFWTGGNAAQMDRLFRQSGLYREKWDSRRGAETYGVHTIARALAGARCTYSGARS
jgi:primase-polymerase (primpol)-like protein